MIFLNIQKQVYQSRPTQGKSVPSEYVRGPYEHRGGTFQHIKFVSIIIISTVLFTL